MVTDQLAELVSTALEQARADEAISLGDLPPIRFERPRRREHGDWSTNVALVVAGGARPRDVAGALAQRIPRSDIIDRVDVAGPGFLNFHLAPLWLHEIVRRAADPAGRFGLSDSGAGARINVEYVSSNPTGPANVVSGRHAAVGDAIANLLEAVGYEVEREFYANDAGRQIALFARSIETRYLEIFGMEGALPDEGYRGEYISHLAQEIAADIGESLLGAEERERVEALGRLGLERMLAATKASLERFGTRFDRWSSEAALHDQGSVAEAVQRLRSAGWVEERDGALWFRASRLGDDKDRVIVRADGVPTYLAADVAYMLDKFGRGFDKLIYVLGSDHHGTLPRLYATADALGFGRGRVELPMVQNVTILRRGRALRASKRAGVIVLLDELMDEVGADAARYTFLTRAIESPLEFDIELAKEQAPENPVYYTQYAHARICSILRRAEGLDLVVDVDAAPLERLVHDSEDALMRKLAAFEEVVPEASRLRAPQRIARYVEDLASGFSSFYRDCRVVTDDGALTAARLSLCLATRAVLASGLSLLGVSAPARM